MGEWMKCEATKPINGWMGWFTVRALISLECEGILRLPTQSSFCHRATVRYACERRFVHSDDESHSLVHFSFHSSTHPMSLHCRPSISSEQVGCANLGANLGRKRPRPTTVGVPLDIIYRALPSLTFAQITALYEACSAQRSALESRLAALRETADTLEREHECPLCRTVPTGPCLMYGCKHIICMSCAVNQLWRVCMGGYDTDERCFDPVATVIEASALERLTCAMCRHPWDLVREVTPATNLFIRSSYLAAACPDDHAAKRRSYYAVSKEIAATSDARDARASDAEGGAAQIQSPAPAPEPLILPDRQVIQRADFSFPCKICSQLITWPNGLHLAEVIDEHLSSLRCAQQPSPLLVCSTCPAHLGTPTLIVGDKDAEREPMNSVDFYAHVEVHREFELVYELHTMRIERELRRARDGDEPMHSPQSASRLADVVVDLFSNACQLSKLPPRVMQLFQCMRKPMVLSHVKYIGAHGLPPPGGYSDTLPDVANWAANVLVGYVSKLLKRGRPLEDNKSTPLKTVYGHLGVMVTNPGMASTDDPTISAHVFAERPDGMDDSTYLAQQRAEYDRIRLRRVRGRVASSAFFDDDAMVDVEVDENDDPSHESATEQRDEDYVHPLVRTPLPARRANVAPGAPSRVRRATRMPVFLDSAFHDLDALADGELLRHNDASVTGTA